MEEFLGKVGLVVVLALVMAGMVCVLDRCQGDEVLLNSLPPCVE